MKSYWVEGQDAYEPWDLLDEPDEPEDEETDDLKAKAIVEHFVKRGDPFAQCIIIAEDALDALAAMPEPGCFRCKDYSEKLGYKDSCRECSGFYPDHYTPKESRE